MPYSARDLVHRKRRTFQQNWNTAESHALASMLIKYVETGDQRPPCSSDCWFKLPIFCNDVSVALLSKNKKQGKNIFQGTKPYSPIFHPMFLLPYPCSNSLHLAPEPFRLTVWSRWLLKDCDPCARGFPCLPWLPLLPIALSRFLPVPL